MAPAPVTPFHFGAQDKRLFGCHHVPHVGLRSYAVVICPPIGQEYIRSHRGLRHLAGLLAQAGFHVLRFDYYGCGDSSGEGGDGHPAQWRRDLTTAVAAARAKSGRESVCLVGLRVGASLAALVAAERHDVEALVLWEPVVNGRDYVEELAARHRSRLEEFPASVDPPVGDGGEALGFALPPTLRESLASIDLRALQARPASDVLVVDNQPRVDCRELAAVLERLGSAVEFSTAPSPTMWIDDLDRVVVPREPIRAIVSWLSGEDS